MRAADNLNDQSLSVQFRQVAGKTRANGAHKLCVISRMLPRILASRVSLQTDVIAKYAFS